MIYFTSDLHLNHYNVIKYCNRPFRSLGEMNSVIVGNWNAIVKPKDTVYLLGDISFYSFDWRSRLNGGKICIKGSHDNNLKADLWQYIHIEGIKVFLVHNPYNIPLDWKGWSIHGHVHNNQPFLDKELKRINVSVEVTGYKPVSLETIKEAIQIEEI